MIVPTNMAAAFVLACKQMTDAELVACRDAVDAEMRKRTTPFKVVYNACYGGFSLSAFGEAILKASGFNLRYVDDVPRNHPVLVAMVERYGNAINGEVATLKVKTVDVPIGYTWVINEYDGKETVDVEPGKMPPPALIDDGVIKNILDKAAEWPRNLPYEPRPISTGWSDDDSSGSDADDKK